MEPIIITDFTITKQELVRLGYISHMKKRKSFYIITSLLFLFLAYNYTEARGKPELTLIGLVLPIYYFLSPWLNLKRFYNHPLNKKLFLSSNMTIKEDRIIATDEEGCISEIVASRIVHVDKIKEFYRLYVSASQSINIPERAFANEEDHQKFRELFNFND